MKWIKDSNFMGYVVIAVGSIVFTMSAVHQAFTPKDEEAGREKESMGIYSQAILIESESQERGALEALNKVPGVKWSTGRKPSQVSPWTENGGTPYVILFEDRKTIYKDSPKVVRLYWLEVSKVKQLVDGLKTTAEAVGKDSR
jgi:hypothetical protein